MAETKPFNDELFTDEIELFEMTIDDRVWIKPQPAFKHGRVTASEVIIETEVAFRLFGLY